MCTDRCARSEKHAGRLDAQLQTVSTVSHSDQVLPFLSRKQPDLDLSAIKIVPVDDPVTATNRH